MRNKTAGTVTVREAPVLASYTRDQLRKMIGDSVRFAFAVTAERFGNAPTAATRLELDTMADARQELHGMASMGVKEEEILRDMAYRLPVLQWPGYLAERHRKHNGKSAGQ